MESKCKICGKHFIAPSVKSKRRTCSPLCAKRLQFKTLGHGPHFMHGFARVGGVENLHTVWRGILSRCKSKTSSVYFRYGGRGIDICKEWLRYEHFRTWAIESGHRKGLSIERVDNNKGYSPDNCIIADRKTQARNRSSSRLILFNGKNITVAELAENMGVKYSHLYYRLSKSGWLWHDKVL